MNEHEVYIRRCFELALMGKGNTLLNPMVGCVIVFSGKIIGEGFHRGWGLPHAEVEAINRVKNKELLRNSIMYVSLEPCCYYGKTPPCTSVIIEKQIPHVVISSLDVNPKVSTKGVQLLRQAGIKVTEGICQQEAKNINIRFNTYHLRKRPYVIIKWAQSADGFIDIVRSSSVKGIKWISNKYSKQIVHKWRAEEQAILIGKNTVFNDNPKLTTRDWPGKNPKRLVIDSQLETSLNYNVYNYEAETYCYHSFEKKSPSQKPHNIHYVPIDFKKTIIQQILLHLHSIEVSSVIVEGGKKTITGFIESNLWDEARVIRGDTVFKNGIKAPELNILPSYEEQILNDSIFYYYND